MKAKKPHLYGVMAQFDSPSTLVAAAKETYAAGYRRINGYSPFPIEELSEAIGFTRTSLPLIVLLGGIVGGVGGFFMQYWMEVIDYPINVAPNFALATRDSFFLVIESNDPKFDHDEAMRFLKSLEARDVCDVEL